MYQCSKKTTKICLNNIHFKSIFKLNHNIKKKIKFYNVIINFSILIHFF